MRVVEEIRATLDARLTGPLGEVAVQYSDAGLVEFPPQVNPGARTVLAELTKRGIPTVIVSNATRMGRSWESFLHRHDASPSSGVSASCDVGASKPDPRIFRAACESLGNDAADVLHVGDLIPLDVEGALSAGLDAARYTGLWSKYCQDEPGTRQLPPDGSGIPILKSLVEILPMFRHDP
jgi:HAD superfamily hydrolase (TIGR01509 family)